MVQQSEDTYGNVTNVSTWNYSTTTPSGTATRSVNTLYNNSCSSPWTGSTTGACPYVNAYILSLPLTSTLTARSATTTLLSNTYDAYSGSALVAVTGLSEFDSTYASPSYTLRGNVTQSVTPGKTTNFQYDVTGMTVSANDNNGHSVNITAASGTNNSAPGTIQPNSNSNLATALSYSPFLGVNSSTSPNNSAVSMTYDSAGRPSTAVSATGASTTYAYLFGTTVNGVIANGAYTTTATTNSHWVTTVADGLGRIITQTSGYGTTSPTTVSEVDTQYAPCGCSSSGKMMKTSQPYLPGATEYWTSYAYDGLGRTLSVTLPDGSSTTKYVYQGNWTTVTDPAGKWKQYETDVFGNTTVVVEPDPAVNPAAPNPPSATAAGTLVTSYSYDEVNHLIGVSMPRTISGTLVTQTRSFVYNTNFQLTSASSPEAGPANGNGTTSYTYNADGTLATRTDPKSQLTSYTYDTYQRVIKVTHGTDATQTVNYYYDTDPLDTNGTFAQNTWGRVAAIAIGTCATGPSYAEEYSYNSAGHTTAKRVSVYKSYSGTCAPVVMTANFNYDGEGKSTAVTYPAGNALGQYPALTVNYTYDSMSRLIGASDSERSITVGGCSPAPPAWNGALAWASNAAYNAAGQLTGLEQLGSVSATCAGTSELYSTRLGSVTHSISFRKSTLARRLMATQLRARTPVWQATSSRGTTTRRERTTDKYRRRTVHG